MMANKIQISLPKMMKKVHLKYWWCPCRPNAKFLCSATSYKEAIKAPAPTAKTYPAATIKPIATTTSISTSKITPSSRIPSEKWKRIKIYTNNIDRNWTSLTLSQTNKKTSPPARKNSKILGGQRQHKKLLSLNWMITSKKELHRSLKIGMQKRSRKSLKWAKTQRKRPQEIPMPNGFS